MLTSFYSCLLSSHRQTLISEAINKASEEVYIEPKYLVPDTNCFISSLPAIQALVKSQLFVVAVPLIGV